MFKNKILTAILALSFALNANAAKIDQDVLILQKPGSSANKIIKMGSGQVIWDATANKMKFSNDAGASSKNFGSGSGGASGINLIGDANPDFESALSGTWTASGGSASQVTSGSNLLFGSGSALFNSSAASQTLSSNAFAIPNGLINNNGLAYCTFKTAATDYKLQVVQVSTVLAENVIPAISGAEKVYVPFVFPGSGNVFLRISSQSDAADLAIDDCFLGSSDTKEFSQASFFGSATNNAACQYSVGTAGSWQSFTNVGTCTGYSYSGGVSASGIEATEPSFKIESMPAGNYLVVVSSAGFYAANNGASPQTSYFSLYDGTNRYFGGGVNVSLGSGNYIGTPNLSFSVNVPASQQNVVFKIQAHTNNQATVNVDGTAGSNTAPLVFSVYRFPSGSEQVQRVNEQPSYGILKFTGTAASLTSTSASFVTLTDAGMGSGPFEALGSASQCSTNSTAVCIKMGKLKQGLYDVYFNGGMFQASTAECVYRMYDGSNAIGEFYSVPPNAVGTQFAHTGFHGKLSVPADVYDKEIYIQTKMQSGSGGCSLLASTGSGAFELGVIPTTMSVADHILKNSVQSPYSGQVNRVSARTNGVCSSDPCTLVSFKEGITVINRTGVGQYVASFPAGICGGEPNPSIVSADSSISCASGALSSTSIGIDCRNFSGSLSDGTAGFTVSGFCQKP